MQYAGATSAALTLPVANAAPGVFTITSAIAGQAAVAVNQDGSTNGPGNPAAPGSYVTVYATGGGITDPPGVTGSISGRVESLAQSVTATVGGVPAFVSFAGAAPGFVDGVNQLNIQLSSGTPAGNVPLVITVGGQVSANTPTLSVQ